MKWFDMSNDERAEWRQLERTQAFLEVLRDADGEFGTDALNDLVAGRVHEAAVEAGKQEGVVHAIRLFNYEDKQ